MRRYENAPINSDDKKLLSNAWRLIKKKPIGYFKAKDRRSIDFNIIYHIAINLCYEYDQDISIYHHVKGKVKKRITTIIWTKSGKNQYEYAKNNKLDKS